MQKAISVNNLCKTYEGGFQALKDVSLEIEKGEIFALLGPNGAGKTTLINIVCGIVRPSSGNVLVNGHDIVREYRAARSLIGLVPQELSTDTFESVWATVNFSRGLFGKPKDHARVESVLRSLTLWDKRDSRILTLSGGMKRRVLIAKALAHDPQILFLDEPTAGVDVELRQDMWEIVRRLRESGVTVILTTHYIEEAEQMADRIGVINHGELILVQEKSRLMRELGKRQLVLQLQEPLATVPEQLNWWSSSLISVPERPGSSGSARRSPSRRSRSTSSGTSTACFRRTATASTSTRPRSSSSATRRRGGVRGLTGWISRAPLPRVRRCLRRG
jgi:ABC-2 type transport system ATP-binding protein